MKTSIKTFEAPEPIGPFSHAIVAGNMAFVSAQFARDNLSSKFLMDTIEIETTQVMKNLSIILKEAGLNFNQVVKASIFLKDMKDYAVVNDMYSKYFDAPYPARETIQVGGLPMT